MVAYEEVGFAVKEMEMPDDSPYAAGATANFYMPSWRGTNTK